MAHPSLIQGTNMDVRAEPWVDEILQMGPTSSAKLRAAAVNALGDQPPDFLNFMSVTGESAAAREQRFLDLYEIYPGALNLPRACFRLFRQLDAWIPGWRLVSGQIPEVFAPKSLDVHALQQAIEGHRATPRVEPFSPATVYKELHMAVLRALPMGMHDLKIGDHVYRKSCHVAWSEMSVSIGGQRRRLTEPERDRCLGRSTHWSSESVLLSSAQIEEDHHGSLPTSTPVVASNLCNQSFPRFIRLWAAHCTSIRPYDIDRARARARRATKLSATECCTRAVDSERWADGCGALRA
eukprot:COSAG02_NODE_2636_length_8361_cov_6.129993_5_plen_296_part_00